MIRVLKYPASGGFIGDLAGVSTVEDLTNYKINPTDDTIIVRNAPFDTLKEARDNLVTPVLDASDDPENQIIVTRRCRYFVNLDDSPAAKKILEDKGWIDVDWSVFANFIQDAA